MFDNEFRDEDEKREGKEEDEGESEVVMRNNTSPMRSPNRKNMKKKTRNATVAVARRGKKEVMMDLRASLSLTGRLKQAWKTL